MVFVLCFFFLMVFFIVINCVVMVFSTLINYVV